MIKSKLSFKKVLRVPSKKRVYLISFLVLVVIHIFVSLQTVAYGSEISILEKEKEKMERENRLLTSEVVEATSLIKLSEKSEDFGFSNPEQTLYLSQDEEVAVLHGNVR